MVIWRKLDRLAASYRHDGTKRSAEINAALSEAEQHLRLCFHRYMEGTRPQLRLMLNDRKLPPIDPFACANKATQVDDEELLPLANGTVITQTFTLPHHSRVSKTEWEEVGGRRGIFARRAFASTASGG